MLRALTSLLIITLAPSLTAQNIHRTACQGNLVRLDSMLTKTAIDIEDHRGRSLLHWAVACKQRKVFDYLVKKGISINGEDQDKKTPLHLAVQYGNDEYFELLIKLQDNTSWKVTYGASLIEQAVLNRDSTFIKKLINNGVDINSKNSRGSSALEISERIGATAISQVLVANGADKSGFRAIEMSGKLMGQADPGTTPSMFAPNFVSTEEHEFGSVFNATMTEFYYGVAVNGKNDIRYSKRVDNKWSKPKIILSHERYGYNDPFLSPDENRLYFISRRPLNGIGDEKEDHDIWYVERTEEGWSAPINAGTNINSNRNEYYISFTKDGTMYFSSSKNAPAERKESDLDIFFSRSKDGKFQEAISLPTTVNTEAYEADVFVDPDENYIIFCGIRSKGLGNGDLYISFRKPNGTWSKAMNMGAPVNTKYHELCPYVTSDGKYLFYTSNGDIYWVSTTIIKELKEKSE